MSPFYRWDDCRRVWGSLSPDKREQQIKVHPAPGSSHFSTWNLSGESQINSGIIGRPPAGAYGGWGMVTSSEIRLPPHGWEGLPAASRVSGPTRGRYPPHPSLPYAVCSVLDAEAPARKVLPCDGLRSGAAGGCGPCPHTQGCPGDGPISRRQLRAGADCQPAGR